MPQCFSSGKQISITLCVYLGQMLAGYILSWTAPAIPILQDLNQSPIPRLLSNLEISLLASVAYVAGIPAVLSMSWLSNYKGRKLCLIMGSCAFVVSFILLAITNSYAMLLTSRFISALGASTAAIMNVLYIGEIASKNIRGVLLTGLGIVQTLGSLLVLCVGPYVSFTMIAYIGLTLSIIYFIAMLFIEESPVFYLIRGKEIKVQNALHSLKRIDELEDVLKMKPVENNKKNDSRDLAELFTVKCNRKGLFIVTIISIFQYGSGSAIVISFATSIFEMAGSSVEPNIATIIIGCTQFTGSIIAPIFVEKSGRRSLLLISTAICSVSMMVFGLYFYLNHIDTEKVENIKWLPLVLLVVFYLSNSMGFGVIPNTLVGEMFKPNVRSKGVALVITISWIFGFSLTTVFNSMVSEFGAYTTFWLFAVICGLAFLFTFFFIPETKGKSLSEITDMLNK